MTATLPIAGAFYRSWNRHISSGPRTSAMTCTVCEALLDELKKSSLANARMIDLLDNALSSNPHADFQSLVEALNVTKIALDLANEQYRQHVATHGEQSTLSAGWST